VKAPGKIDVGHQRTPVRFQQLACGVLFAEIRIVLRNGSFTEMLRQPQGKEFVRGRGPEMTVPALSGAFRHLVEDIHREKLG
jgi:hypothetical protein